MCTNMSDRLQGRQLDQDLRPIIGESRAVLHTKRVCIIGEVVNIINGILRHLPLIIVRSIEEEGLAAEYGWLIIFRGAEEGGVCPKKAAVLRCRYSSLYNKYQGEEYRITGGREGWIGYYIILGNVGDVG